jgi:phage-related protein
MARVLFCISHGQMVLLHGFIKKSRKTPKPDLDLAMERKRIVEREQ